MFSFQLPPEIFFYFRNEMQFLFLIHFHYCIQDFKIIVSFGGRLHQCLNIFWKAAASVSDSRKQKPFTNAFITSNAAAHHI